MQEVVVPHQDLIHILVRCRSEPPTLKVKGLHDFSQVTGEAQIQSSRFARTDQHHDRVNVLRLLHLHLRESREPEDDQFWAGEPIMAAIGQQHMIAQRVQCGGACIEDAVHHLFINAIGAVADILDLIDQHLAGISAVAIGVHNGTRDQGLIGEVLLLRAIMNDRHQLALEPLIAHLSEAFVNVIDGAAPDQLTGCVELEPERAGNGQHAGKANCENAHFNDQPERNQDAQDRQPRIER